MGTLSITAGIAAEPIDLPSPRPRTRGRLLDVARDLDVARWAGVEWLPWPGADVQTDAVDCDVVYAKDARVLPDLEDQPAFLLWDALKCSTAGIRLSTLARFLGENLADDGFLSATLGAELESADGSGGNSLANTATVVSATAQKLGTAIALLEDFLASTLHGGLGVIHLTPGLFAVGAGMYYELEGEIWRTATGHAVIGDAGHTGEEPPTGQAAPGTDQRWIYASGDIWYATSAVKGVVTATEPDAGAVYVLQNDNRPLAERYGILVFDPNLVGAVLVDYSDSVA